MISRRFSALLATFLIIFGTITPRTPNRVGVSNGLSVTVDSNKGHLMPLRAELQDGKGKLRLLGSPGKEFKKSAKIAFEYARAHAQEYGADADVLSGHDVYIYLPNYHVDGNSAGTALLTAMISAYTDRPIDNSYAMTGAINKNGRVLPIGSLKAKMKGARKSGINDIIAPAGNYYNYKDSGSIRKKVDVEFVHNVREVLDRVLL